MSEHWKSTPKYWCKHCATYVRDTKLERSNHEATGKHQGAVKRALSNLHRAANTEERERARARREIDRLNGVVVAAAPPSAPTPPGGAAVAERKRQAEQLAALGVALPQAFRGDLAMPGEWSVTSTTTVGERADDEAEATKARAKGVHKRERTDENHEHEATVDGLFKRPRRWGRGTAHAGGEATQDLDALLNGGLDLVINKKDKHEQETIAEPKMDHPSVKAEDGASGIKREPSADAEAGSIPAQAPVAHFKTEEPSVDVPNVKAEGGKTGLEAANIPPLATFKKRKPKNIRQK